MRLDAIPEELGVLGFRGPHHGVGVQVLGHRAGRVLRFAGLEFEYPPVHFGDVFVADPPNDVLVDEPTLAETGLLGSDHVAHLRGDADFLARLQVPVIRLLAVRRDHADVAVVVHQLHDRAHGIVGRPFATQAEHRPHLNHGRWGDNSGVTDRAGRVLIPVDGVGVADGFDPAVDHRLVHRIAADTRLGDDGGFDLREGLVDIRHLGTLGTLRPDAAIISRITSFTPPPKVITKLRLVCESSQSSSSAVSDSAGLPYLPTISSASRPMY